MAQQHAADPAGDDTVPRQQRPRSERLAAWPAWTTILALAFVMGSLGLLAGLPIWLNQRLGRMQQTSTATTARAASLLTQLRYSLAEEVTANQEYRSLHEAADLADYWSARARADSLLAQLAPVAASIDGAAEPMYARLSRLVRTWDALQAARANGAMTEAQFVQTIPTLQALHDSLLGAVATFDAHITAIESDRRRTGATLIARQETVALVLGFFALIAGAIVAWLAWRERRLTGALASALSRERRLRAESEQRRLDLQRVTESKERLIRGFTHDVKNPLGAADGFLAMMQEEMHGPLTTKQGETLARVRRALRTALTLVTDLLELAKAESAEIAVHFEAADICALTNEVADDFRGQIEAKGLELRIDNDCDALEVMTDTRRLREVLGNLVSNAAKYTDRGYVEIRAHRVGDADVQVDVTDSGRGIPADKIGLLFREFVRLDPSAAEGTGLGLAITQQMAEALGATISVSSELGRGSVFSVRLPVRKRHYALTER